MVVLPALSIAVTVKVCVPGLVSSGWPLGTVPVHEATPAPPASAQSYAALTASPLANTAPCAGVVSAIAGGVESTVYVCVTELVAPSASVAVTVNALVPAVAASIAAPFATVPSHWVTAASVLESGAQAKSACTAGAVA